VQIKPNQGNSTPFPSATSGDAPAANAHAALFSAQLALARWMHGGDVPHVFACSRSIGRAAWYAEAQAQFQSWLDAGGFHQAEVDGTGSAIQDASPSQRLAAPDSGASANPAWYDVTRCRLVQDRDLAE